MHRTPTADESLRDQAAFLRNMAQIVRLYQQNRPYLISMGWLIDSLNEAARECENEVNATE